MATPGDKLLTETQAAELLGVSPTTLATWRCRRRYSLPFVKLGGGRAVRYIESDVIAFGRSGRVAAGGSGLEAAASGGV